MLLTITTTHTPATDLTINLGANSAKSGVTVRSLIKTSSN